MKNVKNLMHKIMIIIVVICVALSDVPVIAAPIQLISAGVTDTFTVSVVLPCSLWSSPETLEKNRIGYLNVGDEIAVVPTVVLSGLGDGNTFYMTADGAYVLCGCVSLGAGIYPFVTYGLVLTDKGVMWMQENGAYAVSCWMYGPDRIHYVDENGYVQLGMTEIGGKIYYLYPEGRFAQGWTQIGNDLYFFSFDGAMAEDTVVDGLYLGNNGKAAVEGDEIVVPKNELREQVDAILLSIITPEMTEEEKISACYWYIVNNYSYQRTYETPQGDWTGSFALEIFTTGKGNCYRYASAFAYLLHELGYETKVITGRIGARSGGTTPHGWTEVKIGDVWYVFDTELQYANRDRDYYWKTYATYPSSTLEKQQEWPVHF